MIPFLIMSLIFLLNINIITKNLPEPSFPANSVENPKSAIFIKNSLLRRIFSGLISLCAIP